MTKPQNSNPHKRWIPAKESPWKWVQKADQVYVAARFLYWKGFLSEFALLGAHAIELYLKAYLIHRTSKYIWGHDLAGIYQTCMELDDFFKDEALVGNFLPLPMPDATEKWTYMPWSHLTWSKYKNALPYPEPLPRGHPTGGVIIPGGYSGCARGGTCWALDCIADYVKQQVPQPEKERDLIDNLLHGTGDIWQITDNLQELRDLLLCGNWALQNKQQGA